jgi:transcriptional regulator with XRE-family HTH domain
MSEQLTNLAPPAAGPDTSGLGARLRQERERQGIGVRELSRRVDVTASMISQIETGRVMPSVNTLYSLVSALGISFDALFESGAGAGLVRASTQAHGPVQRRGLRRRITLATGVHWERLTSTPDPNVEFLLCIYDVGSESTGGGALVRHGGREYGYVESGRLGVTVGFDTYELEEGDSIAFDSSTPHRLFNLLADRATHTIWLVVGRHDDPRVPG